VRVSQFVARSANLIGPGWVWMSLRAPTCLICVSDEVDLLLRDNDFDTIPSDVRDALIAHRVIVEQTADREVLDLQLANRRDVESSDTLVRTVFVSADCPLGCNSPTAGGYCGQSHRRERMLSDSSAFAAVLDEVKEALRSHHRRLDWGYFGGEPLLALDTVLAFQESLRELCQGQAVALDASVTTSGLHLTTRTVRALVEAGIRRFDITLDGRAAVHDARRPTKSGRGTFDSILTNIKNICEDSRCNDVAVAIRMNVDGRNADEALPLLEELIAERIVPRCEFYVAPVHNWSGHVAEWTADREAVARVEMSVLRRLSRISLPVLLPHPRPTPCVATNPNAKVISHAGDAHRCTQVPLTRAEYSGSGLVQLRTRAWADQWDSKVSSGAVPCLRCHLLPVCGGACPKDWEAGMPPCPTYKFNLQDRIALQWVLTQSRWTGDSP